MPVIWIHDYHLMEVATIVRRVASQEALPCKIGYFMHIPFPPWDMIKIHPWKDFFLQGILGSDLVGECLIVFDKTMTGAHRPHFLMFAGFQCQDFALNFIDCCERGLGTWVDRWLVSSVV